MKRGEAAAIARYWVSAISLTVGCFIACCVAAGLL